MVCPICLLAAPIIALVAWKLGCISDFWETVRECWKDALKLNSSRCAQEKVPELVSKMSAKLYASHPKLAGLMVKHKQAVRYIAALVMLVLIALTVLPIYLIIKGLTSQTCPENLCKFLPK